MEVKDWEIIAGNWLYRKFSFRDFVSALEFVNKVGAIAEELNHHPNIDFTWGCVAIRIQTHDVKDLTDKDYELAKHINDII